MILFGTVTKEGGKRNPSMGGMRRIQRIYEPWIYGGKADQIWGPAKWPLSISVIIPPTVWTPLAAIGQLNLISRGTGIHKEPVPYTAGQKGVTHSGDGAQKQPLSLPVFLHLFLAVLSPPSGWAFSSPQIKA